MIDWTTAYDNRRAVAGAAAMHDRWLGEAETFREKWGSVETIAHGAHGRETVDLFRPEGAAGGLAVFLHGGYWHRNSPAVFWHLAAGALARGWAVAMPGYPLCPEVTIAEITRSVAAGVAVAAARVEGPLRIAGHSAGGHLATRMACRDVLPTLLAGRVGAVLSISGLHDLRPLRRTPMQPVLRLTPEEARAESPALLEPGIAAPVTAWVGAEELPELRRQSALLANVWTGLGVPTRLVEDAGHDHFSVIEPLAEPDSPITEAWLG